ncbi:amphi-Trp domain-containing protein [Halovivax gelatinilyticus]|uniref:amphi-Trp domain-containing protein n=1 Tax=Halovivax gelatinilyticus TaxID=2961597 RepID=UPI0020CA6A96|nr:amphi-Trp domain-containing protein [Halovivax gelatinilyticus]
MVERTDDARELGRKNVAALLRDLADEFERGGERISVPVGNKTVTLNPPDEFTTEVEVLERSGVFRGAQERVRIDLRWKPADAREEAPREAAPDQPES